jgi:hypothetical protein
MQSLECDETTDDLPLIVCPFTATNWVVVKEFSFCGSVRGNRIRIVVPPKFITDFASIPRPFWIFAPPWGMYGWGAVLHDFMYWDQSRARRSADSILLQAMKRAGVVFWKAFLIYAAVRLFGCFAWRKNKRDKQCHPGMKFFEHHEGPFHREQLREKIGALRGVRRSLRAIAGYVVVIAAACVAMTNTTLFVIFACAFILVAGAVGAWCLFVCRCEAQSNEVDSI